MKDAATKSYSKKGEKIVKMNHDAIERGASEFVKIKVPASWKNAADNTAAKKIDCGEKALTEYVNNVLMPANHHQGDQLPVSAVLKMADGTVPAGSAAYEKRGIAIDVPE